MLEVARNTATTPPSALRKREHIEYASLRRGLLQLLRRVGESQRRRRIACIESAGHHGSRPSAHARKHRDILLAVRSLVRHGLADDPGPGLELPQLLSGNRVQGLEPAVHGPVEDDIAGGDDSATPDRKLV